MRAWYVLSILILIYICNIADRNILAILAHDVKRDLNLTDLQLGLLVGPAIGFFYAILGLPMAYLADRTHRVRFLAVCLLVWSCLTAAGSLARNGIQLALSRVGVSAMEAGGSPCSASIIADYFDPARRPLAMGFYSAASVAGLFVGLAFGGVIDDAIGWRGAFVLAGVPGLLLTVLLLTTVHEPVRGARDRISAVGGQAVSLWRTLKELWSIQLYRRVVLAAGAANFCIHGVSNWSPTFIIRKFGVTPGDVGLLLGLGMAGFGGISMIGGGVLMSYWARIGLRRSLMLTGLLQFASIPIWTAALYAMDYHTALLLHAVAYGTMSFFAPTYWVAAQSHTPSHMRATAAALALMIIAVVGASLSAPAIGALSDALAPRFGGQSLQYALTAVALLAAIPGVLFFCAAGARNADADIR